MGIALWTGLPLAVLVLVSFLVEASRRQPVAPTVLAWDPAIPVVFVNVGGVSVRYVKAGTGPTLVLLHTLRTQLDIFQKVIPSLVPEFTVYAVDYPGHGWSDIPKADYTPEFFTRFVTEFLETLELRDVLLAGVSIGASIPLCLAAERNPRVRAVVSVNPYDYGRRGVARANAVARILATVSPIPIVGGTFMRLRNRLVEGKILEGGVTRPEALPAAFREEVFVAGERAGHYQAFLNLIRHMPKWRRAHDVYGKIQIPVLLVYGDHDWSRVPERQTTLREIPGARLVTVESGGHFLTLDQPQAVVQHLRAFARELRILPAAAATATPAT